MKNNTDNKEKKPKTFIQYSRSTEGKLKEIGKFKGHTPSQAARKAIMQEYRKSGRTEGIKIILRQTKKVGKGGVRKLRFYSGRIKDECVIDPKMASHQRKLAIKRESWVLDDNGNPQTVFDDGYDSIEDPILRGRRPVFIAKRAVSSWKGLEDMPNVKLTGL